MIVWRSSRSVNRIFSDSFASHKESCPIDQKKTKRIRHDSVSFLFKDSYRTSNINIMWSLLFTLCIINVWLLSYSFIIIWIWYIFTLLYTTFQDSGGSHWKDLHWLSFSTIDNSNSNDFFLKKLYLKSSLLFFFFESHVVLYSMQLY